MQRILTVCVGNICRSPVAEALLQAALPEHRVGSAGIGAVVGSDVDPTARKVAESSGVVLRVHQARQFTKNIGARHDLILVFEAGHKRQIERIAPEFSGKTFLLSHWTDAKDIPDPHRKSEEFHQIVYTQTREASAAWAQRLSRT